MEKPKDDKKTPKTKRKSRAKVLSAKEFLDMTKTILLTKYSHAEQNTIVKDLYFAIRENREMEIAAHKNSIENLVKFNEDLPISK